jgi:hypothetical protein
LWTALRKVTANALPCATDAGLSFSTAAVELEVSCGRDMARFMQQSQPHVAAFIHYCFLVRDDPAMVGSILPLVFSDTESEADSSELVEVSS